jgi:hypothetical protein
MIAMQPLGIKSQFLPTSDIFATPKLAVRSLDDVRLAKPTSFATAAKGGGKRRLAIS